MKDGKIEKLRINIYFEGFCLGMMLEVEQQLEGDMRLRKGIFREVILMYIGIFLGLV